MLLFTISVRASCNQLASADSFRCERFAKIMKIYHNFIFLFNRYYCLLNGEADAYTRTYMLAHKSIRTLFSNLIAGIYMPVIELAIKIIVREL